MSITQHLEELRSTVIKMVGIIFVSFALCYAYGDILSEFLLVPLRDALSGDTGQIGI